LSEYKVFPDILSPLNLEHTYELTVYLLVCAKLCLLLCL